MKPPIHLDEVLDELRQEHRSVKAPLSLEERLVTQIQRADSNRPSPRVWIWAGGFGIAMAACVAVVSWLGVNHPGTLAPLAHVTPAGIPTTSNVPAAPDIPVASGPSRVSIDQHVPQIPTVTTRRAKAVRHKTSGSNHIDSIADDNTAEDFLPLPSSEGLPAPSAASVVRLRIETASLRQYGLEIPSPAAPENVLAEFVVGEDGLPRAIRILR